MSLVFSSIKTRFHQIQHWKHSIKQIWGKILQFMSSLQPFLGIFMGSECCFRINKICLTDLWNQDVCFVDRESLFSDPWTLLCPHRTAVEVIIFQETLFCFIKLSILSLHNSIQPYSIMWFSGLNKSCTYIIRRGKNSVRQVVIRKVTFLLHFYERHCEVAVILWNTSQSEQQRE